MPHFFFFFWNVPDSWGAVGLRAVPLFTPGGWVGGLGVRDVSCSITKGGRCGHKTFQKMLDSIAIRLWMVKSSAEQFLREQWVTSKTPQVHLLLSFPTGHELVNWWCDFIKSTIKTYKSQIFYVWYIKGYDDGFECLDITISSHLQEVHELLGNYDLKYCFVDKYKGTGWSHCWSVVSLHVQYKGYITDHLYLFTNLMSA